MLGAVLDGHGLQGLVQLAWEEGGCPVAISLPGRALEASAPKAAPLAAAEPTLRVPIVAGGDPIGTVSIYGGLNGDGPEVDCREVANAAALAAVAELGGAEARDEGEHDLRASAIEDLREGSGGNVLPRVARLGRAPSSGGIVLAAEIPSSRPRGAVGLIETEWPGSL